MPRQSSRVVPVMRVVLVASLALIAGAWVFGFAIQTPSSVEYFSEIGHNVRGDFLRFFRERGGLEIFGYPITEEFMDKGRLVQYFQRVRMEQHPENAEPYRVQLGLLPELMGNRTPPIDRSKIPPASDLTRRYYPQTGHTVAPEFLGFFDAKGGVDIFGYPIAELTSANGITVQYFQRARMELYPDRPTAQRVKLTDMGDVYFDWARIDRAYRDKVPARPETSETTPVSATLRVDASVETPYTAFPGKQTVHVYVTDQQKRAKKDAGVTIEVVYPDHSTRMDLQPTDKDGYTSYTFDLEPAPLGHIVVVRVSATSGADTGKTQTAFFYWR